MKAGLSRSALPHVRDLDPNQWTSRTTFWGHVGLYGYRADVLAGWQALLAGQRIAVHRGLHVVETEHEDHQVARRPSSLRGPQTGLVRPVLSLPFPARAHHR